jgi:tRNA(adenine34) deaminase
MEDLHFLVEALKEAKKAFYYGEVPVGAVVVKDSQVISRAFNRKEFLQDPTAHAELLAIREASRKLNSWRLTGCTLYTTLEPCVMCCGAIIQARVSRLVYAALDPKFGGVESLYSILTDPRGNHRVEVVKIELEEASAVLREFFKALR